MQRWREGVLSWNEDILRDSGYVHHLDVVIVSWVCTDAKTSLITDLNTYIHTIYYMPIILPKAIFKILREIWISEFIILIN